MKITESPTNKSDMRKQIKEDTRAFLESGKKVTKVPYGLQRKHLGPKK